MWEYYFMIVYAHNKLEALNEGKELFKDLIERVELDIFKTWDQDPSDEYLSVLNVDHPEAKELIDDIMEEMWGKFKSNITRVRKLIEKCSDEEIFEEYSEKPDTYPSGTSRFDFYLIGEGKGPNVYLYDNDGEGIINRTVLKKVLNKWSHFYQDKENPYKDLDVFIVPALIHH